MREDWRWLPRPARGHWHLAGRGSGTRWPFPAAGDLRPVAARAAPLAAQPHHAVGRRRRMGRGSSRLSLQALAAERHGLIPLGTTSDNPHIPYPDIWAYSWRVGRRPGLLRILILPANCVRVAVSAATRPPRPAAGPGRVRAACAWSAVCRCRDRSAPAVPSATWTISPSWRIDPRRQGSRYHEGEIRHVNRRRSSLPLTHRTTSNPGNPGMSRPDPIRGVTVRNNGASLDSGLVRAMPVRLRYAHYLPDAAIRRWRGSADGRTHTTSFWEESG